MAGGGQDRADPDAAAAQGPDASGPSLGRPDWRQARRLHGWLPDVPLHAQPAAQPAARRGVTCVPRQLFGDPGGARGAIAWRDDPARAA